MIYELCIKYISSFFIFGGILHLCRKNAFLLQWSLVNAQCTFILQTKSTQESHLHTFRCAATEVLSVGKLKCH